jgi:predicted porin
LGVAVNKPIVYAFALAGFAASAQAGDLDLESLKNPLPDALGWHGVTIYGTVDVGYGYQAHGAPGSGTFEKGIDYNIYTSKYANRAISSLDPNALEGSKIGVKIEEVIGNGWLAVGKLETGFNPLSGELADGLASLLSNAGAPLAAQNTNGDSARQGQALNGVAYGGLSSAVYGTLTAGRQQSLQHDAFGAYDPQGGSYAFGFLGWSSSLGGAGISAGTRQDESVKYIILCSPFHAAGMYAQGGPDTGFFGPAYGANVGATYAGFSIDAVYQKVNAGVQLAALTARSPNGDQSIYAPPANYSNTALNGTVTDSDSWSIQAKYKFIFGDGPKNRSLKDGGTMVEAAAGSRLTVFAGFEDIRYYNSSQARDLEYVGQTVGGGYVLGTLPAVPGVSRASSIYFYASTRELQLEWTGARFELASGWSFTAAYYHLGQNAFSSASALSRPQAGAPNQQPGYNAGGYNDGSFVVDYQFNKHLDVYAGVNYSCIDGGLASGFLANDNASFISGARLRF